ncbi:5-amino-6-(5-phospho-D-ribitylamino)uracil phosphatase YigB [Vibrio sp. SM6]|uniref:5-amino-6-(5-phospho-D-ribitylamino)uracil phosphatase YigB n=1 Tax=Vibrio agarilyticus TaxID=2726741 RepID=A0A7X8TRU5_9VIBR|nr:5-amino-6-(5-phospho-D-ribitylamino)uracil phosphatase YigB [Vibrio agarilyticus]NLS13650.1 5-amino-6-(5-phospho-D-ribitylamino)uracil phosphatase YigB [Vibrio agarilyticus]
MVIYRPFAAIQAVTFDLDDTLYDNRPVIMALEQQMRLWLQDTHPATAHLTEQDWRQLRLQALSRWPKLKSDVSASRHAQLRLGFLQSGYTPLRAEKAACDGMTVAHYWRNQVTVPQETHHVLTALAQHFPLVAITNGNVDVTKIGLSDYFCAVLKAGIDGEAKPDASLFAQAAARLSVNPSAIMHVGDHLLTDVLGANLAGFCSCWFNPTSQTVRHTPKARSLPHWEIRRLPQLLALL